MSVMAMSLSEGKECFPSLMMKQSLWWLNDVRWQVEEVQRRFRVIFLPLVSCGNCRSTSTFCVKSSAAALVGAVRRTLSPISTACKVTSLAHLLFPVPAAPFMMNRAPLCVPRIF